MEKGYRAYEGNEKLHHFASRVYVKIIFSLKNGIPNSKWLDLGTETLRSLTGSLPLKISK